MLLLVAAGASAALGRQWSLRNVSVESATRGSDKQPQTASEAAQATRTPSSVTSSAPAGIASIEEPQNPLLINDLSRSESSSLSEASARVDAAPRSSPVSEKELVFDAMRALRREGQPVRAAKLLDEYLRRYPKGSLSEEALALAIEAASATGDPRAKGFADRYLASYPTGRFRPAAQRALSRFSQ
jgi:cell pole-organizing protein PopZ